MHRLDGRDRLISIDLGDARPQQRCHAGHGAAGPHDQREGADGALVGRQVKECGGSRVEPVLFHVSHSPTIS
jgi:hypothetical protein